MRQQNRSAQMLMQALDAFIEVSMQMPQVYNRCNDRLIGSQNTHWTRIVRTHAVINSRVWGRRLLVEIKFHKPVAGPFQMSDKAFAIYAVFENKKEGKPHPDRPFRLSRVNFPFVKSFQEKLPSQPCRVSST